MSPSGADAGPGAQMLRFRGARAWFVLSAAIIVIDQVTKRYVVANFEYARPQTISSWLDITLLHNTGAAFSFLAGAGGWQRWLFIALGIAVSLLVVYWLPRLAKGQWMLAAALALIMGGAIGNVIDRVAYGYVVDFIHVHYERHYWPAFNVADMGISVGAVLLIVDAFFARDPDKR